MSSNQRFVTRYSATETAFWDKIAEQYARKPVSDQALYEKKLARTQQYLTFEAEVLELGCGTGSTAIWLAQDVHRIVASDYSPAMIEIAKVKQQSAEITNIEFLCSSIWELPFGENCFDAVLAFNLLHLVEDYDEHIARTFELLRPGGVFVSSTPCAASSLIRFALPLMRFAGIAPKVVLLNQETLERSIVNNGFRIVDRIDTGSSAKGAFLIAKKPY